jgi:hypothetical protein
VEDYSRAQIKNFQAWFANSWQAVKTGFLELMSGAHYFILGSLLAAVVLIWWQAAPLRNAWLRLSGNRWLGRVNHLSPVRLSAGRWLRRFEPVWLAHSTDLSPSERTQWSQVRGELLALRYGPPNPSANPALTFKQARQLLRSIKRQPARKL